MMRGAVLSENLKHRFTLERGWDMKLPTLMFILLNPSIADAYKDDPTVRKGIGFAMRNKYGGIIFCNLFSMRATDPRVLADAERSARGDQAAWYSITGGARNDEHIVAWARRAGRVVAAWGAHETWGRDEEVSELLGDTPLWCFGKTRGGAPRHILYLPYSTPMEPWP